jgi:NADH dehydrogenase
MATYGPLEDKLVVLIGGGGFLGTHLAEDLLRRGARLRIADRHPAKAWHLRPLAQHGQLQFARCNVKDRRSLDAALDGAHAAVSLVGSFTGDLTALHAQGAGWAAQAAAANGAEAFAYVSAMGADPKSDSGYAATKGRGEELVRDAFASATIVRPSVLFGEDDSFLNLFAGYIASLPVVPVFGPDSQLQPLWADDAAEAIANGLAEPEQHGGKFYELACPEVISMLDLNRRIAEAKGLRRHFVRVPDALSRLVAALPLTPINSDQWKMLQRGSLPSGRLPGLGDLGVIARPLELFLDRWMIRYRKQGRFANKGLGPGAAYAPVATRFDVREAPRKDPRR